MIIINNTLSDFLIKSTFALKIYSFDLTKIDFTYRYENKPNS